MKKLFIGLVQILILSLMIFNMSSCKKEVISSDDKYTSYIDIRYGNYKRNYLDLYIPNNYEYHGIIVFIHGGGWTTGDKSGYESTLKEWAENGIMCAAINYRYTDKHTTCNDILSDIDKAITRIKTYTEDLGYNIDKMILSGGSAGAHLSLLYGYKYISSSIKTVGIASYSGPTDLSLDSYYSGNYNDLVASLTARLTGNKNITSSNYKEYKDDLLDISPVKYAASSSAPTLIFQGAVDDIVPVDNGRCLNELLTSLSVEHTYIEYPNSSHGLESDPDCTNVAASLFQLYVDKYLK